MPRAVAGPARPSWQPPAPSAIVRVARAIRAMLGDRPVSRRDSLPALPGRLRRAELAAPYLAAEAHADHRRAGAAAMVAAESAVAAREWWAADAWAHRALWHFEREELTLHAIRAARLIGDVRTAAGDPASARRFYAEAIDEARDVGAEREQGLASVGLGRALMQLGDVTTARRLGRAAVELLERSGASAADVAAARDLHGTERSVTPAGGTREGRGS